MSETLSSAVEYMLEVNRSRFVALAMPVRDVDQALEALRARRIADAHHNAWAYRIGRDYRFNVDGEVGGTAGKPILAAIDGQGLDRVAVRVARWFGGVRLGTGGLVRAYGGCAAECLRAAARVPIVDVASLPVRIGFAQEQAVRNALAHFDAEVLAQDYADEGLQLTLAVPRDRLHALRAGLTDLCRGRIGFPDDTPPN
jgi:putative IMPACT (imprinted ancient) family translation regulator